MFSDPIAALATPAGRSALAVIRLSGDGALEVAASVTLGFRTGPPRQARLATFHDASGEPIDRGLYSVFPAPHSYTGEDLVEFSCHGGLVAPTRLLSALHAAGARPAHPGEFTRRAVLNGKLDLVQAEAVGDLISATAPAQARAALFQLDGGLSRRIHQLRDELVELQALLGYQVDFPEEDDGPLPRERLAYQLGVVSARIDRLLATAPAAQRVREGALVVLAGPPNAGKSSLFNALLGQTRALVTEIPGTTRDAIEAAIDILGWPIRLVDTAGLGETSDRIDAMGMEVSRRYVEEADLVLVCVEGQTDGRVLGQASVDHVLSAGVPSDRVSNRLLLRTKSDLGGGNGAGLAVSALTGDGLDRLRSTIAQRIFGEQIALADLEPGLTQARHHEALGRARSALEAARPHLADEDGEPVLAAHHVREATMALNELLGTIDIDEVLDRIFAAFCVGK